MRPPGRRGVQLDVVRGPVPRASHRVSLGVAIALLFVANGGAVIASTAQTRALDSAGLGAALAGAAEPDLSPVSAVASLAFRSVDPALPSPEDVPENAHAPTPEVRLGSLELPAIGVSQGLYEGVTLTSINRGPSHWPGSAMPGQLGNVVIAGHRTTYSKPFYDLDALKPGDELILTTAAGRFTYKVTATEVVPATGIQIIEQTYAFTATLFACHPRGSARQRIVAHFELVDSESAPVAAAG
jgi:sortase A